VRDKEWRVVDGAGAPVDEGLDVGWVIHEHPASAEEVRERFEEDCPDEGPYVVQQRTVGPWGVPGES
jgi:hypothetical protein